MPAVATTGQLVGGWTSPAAWRRRLTPHRLRIGLVLLLALAFYLWTADTSVPFNFDTTNADDYNLLTTAFVHFHTFMPVAVPPGLLHLHNPYDPALNAPYQTGVIHDLLFYHGHFYSSWGPTPVFALFLPFRLTGHQMSQSFAVVVFSFIGLVCSVKLMHVLIRRFVPATPNWLLVVATIGVALGNVVPFMLRRPAQYEVAISCGLCFEMAGLLLIALAVLRTPPSPWKLAWGSLCIGLAMGARLSLVAGGAVPLVVAIILIRRGAASRRILMPALAPVAFCILCLGVYNDVRFGSFGNFGTNYQLAGVDVQLYRTSSLAYVPPGLFSYLLMPARFAITFPHIFLETTALYPFPFPHGYEGGPTGPAPEPAGGLLPTMPITLVLFLIPFLWRRRPLQRGALAMAGGLAALGLAIIVLLAYALFGTTQRYEVDYASELLIAATMVWALLVVELRERRVLRRLATTIGVLFIAFGALVGVAVSFTGYYPLLMENDPGVWNTLEDITSPLATLATKVVGRPVIANVFSPTGVQLPTQNLLTFDDGGASTWLGAGAVEIDVVSPSSGRLQLKATAGLGPGIPLKPPLQVQASSADGTVTTTPLRSSALALPIRVNEGLNRIYVNLVGPTAAGPPADRLYLGTIVVGR